MTPRPAPVLAIAPSLTTHESAGTCTQPSRVFPSKIGLVRWSTASGREGGSAADAAPVRSPAQLMTTATGQRARTGESPEGSNGLPVMIHLPAPRRHELTTPTLTGNQMVA